MRVYVGLVNGVLGLLDNLDMNHPPLYVARVIFGELVVPPPHIPTVTRYPIFRHRIVYGRPAADVTSISGE